jgi:hypothetical protein
MRSDRQPAIHPSANGASQAVIGPSEAEGDQQGREQEALIAADESEGEQSRPGAPEGESAQQGSDAGGELVAHAPG